MDKAQFKIQQMSFMLLAVILFFIMAGMFWLIIAYSGVQQDARMLRESEAILKSQYIAGMTEFTCPDKDYCVDTDKLMAFEREEISNRYGEFWDIAYIEVRKNYPIDERKEIVCNSGNYPDCNTFKVYRNPRVEGGVSVGSYVALCRWDKIGTFGVRECGFGEILIGYERR